jgi:hypothetical protein
MLDNQRDAWKSQKEMGDRNAEEQIRQNNIERVKAKQSSRKLGNVFAASGICTLNSPEFPSVTESKKEKENTSQSHLFLMDWALLTITSSRTASNEPPMTDSYRDGACTKLVSGQLCNRCRPLNVGGTWIRRHDVNVAKYGRTAGLTFCTINPALAKINSKMDPNLEEISKVYRLKGYVVGSCYSITKRGECNFAHPGDCGSIIVHDETGSWLGESAAGTGLMIRMAMVLNDIEKITGLTVVEPEPDSNLGSKDVRPSCFDYTDICHRRTGLS